MSKLSRLRISTARSSGTKHSGASECNNQSISCVLLASQVHFRTRRTSPLPHMLSHMFHGVSLLRFCSHVMLLLFCSMAKHLPFGSFRLQGPRLLTSRTSLRRLVLNCWFSFDRAKECSLFCLRRWAPMSESLVLEDTSKADHPSCRCY